METTHVILLALLQGLTEFLPISSSAHLVLVPTLLKWRYEGLAFDVALHVGTLTAVITYFRHEVLALLAAWTGSLRNRQLDGEAKLAWLILLGTLPAALAGLLLHDEVETLLHSPVIIAIATIVFGLLLGWADRFCQHRRNEYNLGIMDAMLLGSAQAMSIIPGISRSGATMTMGLMLGLSRSGAARYSFLMSIPIITLAGGYEGLQLVEDTAPVDWHELLLGTAVSAVTAFLCIHYFLRLIDRMGMMPFVIYRLLLGGVLLWLYA
jgi:undecaprenyl-diphosphatase